MKYVIIGSTVAGIHAAKTLRAHDPASEIYIVSFEINPLGYYDREQMPAHLVRGASNPDDGLIEDAKQLAAQGITVEYVLMETVFPKSSQILLHHGIRVDYDRLLLAMESTPLIHDAPGTNWVGVHQLRIYEDITWIENWMGEIKQHGAVIVSNGIQNLDNDGKLGLEMCAALKQRGAAATYVTSAPHVGAPYVVEAIGERVARKLTADGITVITNQTVSAYVSDDDAVLDAVDLADGRRIPTRMALSTIGAHPTIDVIEERGIETDEATDAVIVNAQMQTNIPNIYAAGSVASIDGYSAHNSKQAAEQGRVAALNMVGQAASYRPFHGDLEAVLYDLPFAYFGTASPDTWTWAHGDTSYGCVFLADGRVQGAQLLDVPPAVAAEVFALYESGAAIQPEQLAQIFQPA
ncbi:MAG: NAD(P)/FAD-dependent oxidoreductase [Chloroflexi bacterium]|nr:NAD(P)/FAD-dependent oxidoreductase [Chloroflexota bacterium]